LLFARRRVLSVVQVSATVGEHPCGFSDPNACEVSTYGLTLPPTAGESVYRDSAVFQRPFKVRLNAAAKRLSIKGELLCQACDQDLCFPGAEAFFLRVRRGRAKNKQMMEDKMKTTLVLVIGGLLAGFPNPYSCQAKDLKDLKVLYVGMQRTDQFVPFIKQHMGSVESRVRPGFKPADAAVFDVVLLDWPQSGLPLESTKVRCPLGNREQWNKPTVLLGSAGLNVADAWKVKGGIGCTCMDPLAYGLRSHEIFEHPFRIDRSTSIHIPTPPDFQTEIKGAEIEVLPLVQDYKRQWNPGWCSYSYDFATNPDVEFATRKELVPI
jgi:hypothetical protein